MIGDLKMKNFIIKVTYITESIFSSILLIIWVYELICNVNYDSVIFNRDEFKDNRISLFTGIFILAVCIAVIVVFILQKKILYGEIISTTLLSIVILNILRDKIYAYFLLNYERFVLREYVYIIFSLLICLVNILSIIVLAINIRSLQ